MRSRVLDQPIDILSIEEAAYYVKSSLVNSRQLKIVTLNPEMVILADKNFELQAAINNANLIVPDGTGITWALKRSGVSEAIRIPGIELTEIILALGDKLKKKVAIFGSKKEILEAAIKSLKGKFPDLNFVKSIDGYHGLEKDKEVAKEISKENPDIILVALGTPRQEIWINKYSDLFPESLMIGVGGSLDVFSGKKKRAPLWMCERGIEWVYRVISEPKRTIRILRSLPVFILKTLLRGQTPFNGV